MKAAVLDRWQEAFRKRVPAAREPAWLSARRQEALERFRVLGFPTRRDEAWRSIDLAPIVRTSWHLTTEPDAPALARAREVLAELEPPVGPRSVLLNGRHVPELSTGTLPAGIRIGALGDAREDYEEGFGDGAPAIDHAFAALNAALFPDTILIDVADGAEAPAPLDLVSLAIGGSEPRAAHPRVLVRVGRQARVALAWTWAGWTEAPFLSNAIVALRLGEASRVDWLGVQRLPPGFCHVVGLGIEQGRDAVFSGTCAQYGADLVRIDLDAHLSGEGAACRLDGVSVLGGTQHVDVRTNVEHAEPHGTSRQLWKSILDDGSSVAFAGRVLVQPGAQKTDARQANHSLLLSKRAVADSVPQLEIFADDVKCAHGATVGQLDEEALFYLRSRAMGLEEARAMLVRAFAAEVADHVEHRALSARARALLDAWLGAEDA